MKEEMEGTMVESAIYLKHSLVSQSDQYGNLIYYISIYEQFCVTLGIGAGHLRVHIQSSLFCDQVQCRQLRAVLIIIKSMSVD